MGELVYQMLKLQLVRFSFISSRDEVERLLHRCREAICLRLLQSLTATMMLGLHDAQKVEWRIYERNERGVCVCQV